MKKYYIPQERLDKIVFRCLDIQYGDLEKVKGKIYSPVFKKPNSDPSFGILAWESPIYLYVFYKLIDEVSGAFSLDENESKEIIGRWFEDRYKLKVDITIPIRKRSTWWRLSIE